MNTNIIRCRTQLLLKHPFFGTLALKLKVVEDPKIDTMATDGLHLYYNDAWVNSLSEEHLRGVICHEILHCALKHPLRREERNPQQWNAAADYAINILLRDEFDFALPEPHLYNPQFKGMSAEEIYNRIPPAPEMPQWGIVLDPKTGDGQPTAAELDSEWTVAVKQAAEAAKAAGELPDCIGRMVKLAEAKINWREQLARFIAGRSMNDYNWRKPNPLFLYQDLIVPTLDAPHIGHITVGIDTSGSIDHDALSQFTGELNAILSSTHHEGVRVIYCDCEINRVDEYEDGDDINLSAVPGGGGTSFQPIMDSLEDTSALLVFTDMYPYEWPDKPNIPVVWVRTTNTDAPYGDYIDLWART